MTMCSWKAMLTVLAVAPLVTAQAFAQGYGYRGEGPGVSGYYDPPVPKMMGAGARMLEQPDGVAVAEDGGPSGYGSNRQPAYGAGGCDDCAAGHGGYSYGGYGAGYACDGYGCSSGVCGAGSCGGGFFSLDCCENRDPWRLFGKFNERNPLGVTLTGWVNGGVTANDDNPPSDFNGVVTFNDKQDEFQGNQAYVVLEKKLRENAYGWDWGGRVDVLYGTDSRFTEARGLETRTNRAPKWNFSPQYGLALPQAYAELGAGAVSVKAGHFYTIVGYEGVMAPANFFYSHAYTMQYGEPFTHTGLLANFDLGPVVLMGGVDRGWDNWEDDPGDKLSFLGGAIVDFGNGMSLALTATAGQEPTALGFIDDRYFHSVVFSWDVTERITYVLQHDYGFQDRGVNVNQDAEWYGINQYIFYKVACNWTAGVRFEWFRDDDGTRVRGIGDRFTGHPLGNATFVGDFYEVTAGVNWTPTANLTFRPEVRVDWFQGAANGAAGPFADGGSIDQVLFAVDVIYQF